MGGMGLGEWPPVGGLDPPAMRSQTWMFICGTIVCSNNGYFGNVHNLLMGF